MVLSRSLDNLYLKKTILNKEKVPLAGTFSSFFARSNEPCTSKNEKCSEKLALQNTFSSLDVYGDSRDSEETLAFLNLAAGLKKLSSI